MGTCENIWKMDLVGLTNDFVKVELTEGRLEEKKSEEVTWVAAQKVVREQKPRPARRGLFGGEVDKILALRARVGAETDSSSGSEWDAGSDSG